MTKAWKGMLIEISPEVEAQLEKGELQHLPSPDSLRNKILIKVKWAPPPDEGAASSSDAVNNDNGNIAPREDTVEVVGAGGDTTQGNIIGSSPEKKKPEKIIQSLSRLGVYTRGYTFNHFTEPGKFLSASDLSVCLYPAPMAPVADWMKSKFD